MGSLSIKVVVADRQYPLNIKKEEEEVVRKTAKTINESIKNLQQNYAVRDKQDLLAMAALQLGIDRQPKQQNLFANDESLKQVEEINGKLEDYLAKQ